MVIWWCGMIPYLGETRLCGTIPYLLPYQTTFYPHPCKTPALGRTKAESTAAPPCRPVLVYHTILNILNILNIHNIHNRFISAYHTIIDTIPFSTLQQHRILHNITEKKLEPLLFFVAFREPYEW